MGDGLPEAVRFMKRPTILELEQRCQKPDYRRVGNVMARRITRPLALRVTWLIAPTNISAHAVTLLAAATGVLAAVALGWPDPRTWMAGVVLLQLWYVLDHVDGQLARLRATASLDGVQLDYLMHHLMALVIPIGVGDGIAGLAGQAYFRAAGVVWGVAALMIGLHNDTRYKAFVQRLKRVRGSLQVVGGGGARPQPAALPERNVRAWAGWLARKACEIHVTMNMLSLLALVMLLDPALGVLAASGYLLAMCVASTTVAGVTIARSLKHESAEREFAAWYRPPEGHELSYSDGWWLVEPSDTPSAD
jgi:phosphatidylglycerophosphate synthase